ncbi:hypothetical protein [Coleofasciculus sp. F4-SAH-05]
MSHQLTITYPETSSGMAAALIGTDRVSFLLNLNRYSVSMIYL